MTDRRSFLLNSSAMAAGLGLAAQSEAEDMPHHHHPSEKPNGAMSSSLPKGLKLLSIRQADDSENLGIVFNDQVIDVAAAALRLKLKAPTHMEQLLKYGGSETLHEIIRAAQVGKINSALVPESSIQHGRLFSHPGKIVCVGLNYRRHAREVKMAEPRVPPLFNKFNNALAGHQSTIVLPPKEVAYKFDYETELVIVMGKAARNVSAAEALDYVAGYAVGNDFSARDLQLETPSVQWMIGKTLDGFAPIGPYFVSADLVGNPNDLKLQTRVNGEIRQDWSTNDFIFNCQEQIAYISKHWTLEPGDIIFTGTPQGVILGMPPESRVWLKAGDEIVSTIEKLGELKFRLA